MKRSPYLVALGALLVLGGVSWTVRGLGIVGPSTGSGITVWAFLGPVVTLGGLALLLSPTHRRP